MADISKKLAEIEDFMQVKVKEEIVIRTSFKNRYILEKAKNNSKILDSLKYREQVANMREDMSKLNEHLGYGYVPIPYVPNTVHYTVHLIYGQPL